MSLNTVVAAGLAIPALLARLDRWRMAVLALLAALAAPVAAQAVQPVDGGKYAAGTVIELPCVPPPQVAPDADEYEGGQISSSLRQADGQVLAACTRATDAVRILAVTQAAPIAARLGPGTYSFGRASCGYRGYLLDGVWVDETYDGGQGVDKTRLDCFHDFIPGGGQFEICAGAVDPAGHCTAVQPPRPPWKQRLGLDSDTLIALREYSIIARNETLQQGWRVVAVGVGVVNRPAGMLVGGGGALLAFSGSVAEDIVNDPPDAQYTRLPYVKPVLLPRVHPGRRLKRAAVRRLNTYATHSGRLAALIAEILQGVERYRAATTANDDDAALRQRNHVRANAATLAGLIESAAAVRKRVARVALGFSTGKRPKRAAWRRLMRRVHQDMLQRLTRAGVPRDRATAGLAPILAGGWPRSGPTLGQITSPQLKRAERELAAQLRELSTG